MTLGRANEVVASVGRDSQESGPQAAPANFPIALWAEMKVSWATSSARTLLPNMRVARFSTWDWYRRTMVLNAARSPSMLRRASSASSGSM